MLAVPIAARLGLGSVLGYLSAGMLIGLVPGIGEEIRELQHFAEFGVVMMLFIVGLELAPGALWDLRHRLIGLGGLQIILSCLAIFAAASVLGFPWQTSLAIGLVLGSGPINPSRSTPKNARDQGVGRRSQVWLTLQGGQAAGIVRFSVPFRFVGFCACYQVKALK